MALLNNKLKQLVESINNNVCECFIINNNSKFYQISFKTYSELYLYLSKTIEDHINIKNINYWN